MKFLKIQIFFENTSQKSENTFFEKKQGKIVEKSKKKSGKLIPEVGNEFWRLEINSECEN